MATGGLRGGRDPLRSGVTVVWDNLHLDGERASERGTDLYEFKITQPQGVRRSPRVRFPVVLAVLGLEHGGIGGLCGYAGVAVRAKLLAKLDQTKSTPAVCDIVRDEFDHLAV